MFKHKWRISKIGESFFKMKESEPPKSKPSILKMSKKSRMWFKTIWLFADKTSIAHLEVDTPQLQVFFGRLRAFTETVNLGA